MAKASIPVDLFSPGQVFACLGFLEAADVLLGDAEGGFDWGDEANVRFGLRAGGDVNPFATVLKFLAEAKVYRCAPIGYVEQATRKKSPTAGEDEGASGEDLRLSESFPSDKGDRMALPIRLESGDCPSVDLGHWADGSSRNDFKLYAGNRSAHSIALAMLDGTRGTPKKKQTVVDVKTAGVAALWEQQRDDLIANPFDVVTPMGGSFNFDPRGGWTALDAGYSPDHAGHAIAASPVVEILAAWGLEHARPYELERRQVRYGAWSDLAPPVLARAILGGAHVALLARRFRFELAMPGRNKVVTFAQEEKSV